MKISNLLARIFLTRKCIICSEPISYDEKIPFCSDCQTHWKAFLEMKCHRCGRKSDECTCIPSQIKESSRYGAVWCVFYDSKSKLVANNLVFKLKREYNRDIISFFASEMIKNLKSLLIRHGINYKECIVTYAPRRRRVERKYGFDQSKLLAKEIGRQLSIEVKPTLINKGKRAQKLLTKEERRKNAQTSYFLKKNLDLSGKTVLLVDDLITSGATMKAASELLYKVGANDVIPVAFAKDNR